MKKIKGINYLQVVMQFNVEIPQGSVNLGVVRLEREGRSFVLDTVSSEYIGTIENPDEEIPFTTILIGVEAGIEGDEELEASNFDLTREDILADDLKATLWWEEAVEVSEGRFEEPESVTLYVGYYDKLGWREVKEIKLELELEE